MKAQLRTVFLTCVPPHIAQRLQFVLREPTRRRGITRTGDAVKDDILAAVDRDGFTVIHGYLDRERCDRGIKEFEQAMAVHGECVHRREDDRLFGIEAASRVATSFQDDPLWVDLFEAYSGEPCTSLFAMGNRLVPKPDERNGSGGGWHRDCFSRELKVIVYLTDVTPENGPFQILRRSHSSEAVLADMRVAGLKALHNRISSSKVNCLIERDPARLVQITGPAGTAIIFDTSSIHCGAPIQSGARYAVTNYLSVSRLSTPEGRAYYAPLLPLPVS